MYISVYIPSYNQKALLKQAIDSVLAQTLKPFEIIVVDDASPDGSQEMIRSYANEYPDLIRPFYFEQNQGVSNVRRKALAEVKGDYVTYVDGDDLFAPSKLEKESKLLQNGSYDLVFSNTAYFSEDPLNIQWIWASELKNMPARGNLYLETFLRRFPRGNLFRMELVTMELLNEAGFHDPSLKIYEDYELRIRLAKIAKVNYTLDPLALVRIDSHRLSKSDRNIHKASFEYIFSKHLEEVIQSYPDQEELIRSSTERLLSNFDTSQPTVGKLDKFKRILKFGR